MMMICSARHWCGASEVRGWRSRPPQALALSGERRYGVALLDLHLPGKNGVELLAELRKKQPELEALLLTAHASIETAIQAMKEGAYDYLTKPFHLPELDPLHGWACPDQPIAERLEADLFHPLAFAAHELNLLKGLLNVDLGVCKLPLGWAQDGRFRVAMKAPLCRVGADGAFFCFPCGTVHSKMPLARSGR